MAAWSGIRVQCTRVVSQRIAVDIVPQMVPSDSDSLHSTTSAFRNLPFLRFELIGSLQYYISPMAKWRLHHNETVIPVFEQVKPVVITAVTLICLILNLVNKKSKNKAPSVHHSLRKWSSSLFKDGHP